MKKLFTLLVTAILAITCAFGLTACGDTGDVKAVKDAGVLVVGITDYAPMDYKEAGSDEWIGFDADLANMFAAELGVTCQFVEINWDLKVGELNSRQIDLIWNGMTASEELGQQIDFSVSYAKNAQVAVVAKTSTITTKEQIKTASVAVEPGSAGQAVTVDEGFTNVTAPGNQKQALLEVLAGTSEVAIIDITMAQSIVGKGDFADLKIVEGVSYGDEIFAIGIRKGSNLKESVDKFLKAKYADGTITTLAETYGVGINTEALSK